MNFRDNLSSLQCRCNRDKVSLSSAWEILVRIEVQMTVWDYIAKPRELVPKGMFTNLAVFNYYLPRVLLFKSDSGLMCGKTADSKVYMRLFLYIISKYKTN